MRLLLTMLPVYILGNFHCLGMCGPLVACISRHEFRFFYLLGRGVAYTFAGGVAGCLGMVFHLYFQSLHLTGVVPVLFGSVLFILGVCGWQGRTISMPKKWNDFCVKVDRRLATYLLRDSPWILFWLGCMTLLLPCGQSMIVFSACALEGDAKIGLMNGMCFSLLTTPSLLFAMQVGRWMNTLFYRASYLFSAIVGILGILRGMAEMDWIPHLSWNLHEMVHLVLY